MWTTIGDVMLIDKYFFFAVLLFLAVFCTLLGYICGGYDFRRELRRSAERYDDALRQNRNNRNDWR